MEDARQGAARLIRAAELRSISVAVVGMPADFHDPPAEGCCRGRGRAAAARVELKPGCAGAPNMHADTASSFLAELSTDPRQE